MIYRVLTLVCIAGFILAACNASPTQPATQAVTTEVQSTVPYPPPLMEEPVVEAGTAYPAAVEVITQAPTPYPGSDAGAPAAANLATYTNNELKYQLSYPVDWQVDENGLSQPNQEVIFSPPDAAAFTVYFSVSLDERELETVRQAYQENSPGAEVSEISIAGQPAVQYTMENRVEIYVPYQERLYLIYSDQPLDDRVVSMLSSFQFLP